MHDKILNAATIIAERPGGLVHLTRELVARQAKCAPGLVSYYFVTMEELRAHVVHHAVQHHNLLIVGQAVAMQLPGVASLSQKYKTQAVMSLV